MLKSLWNDEGGAVVSPEVCVIAVILVIGVIVGISAVQTALHTEILDVGAAIESMDFTPELVPLDELNSQQLSQNEANMPTTAADLIDGE